MSDQRIPIRYDSYTGEPIYAAERECFGRCEILFAWFCFVAGYLFWRVFASNFHPLGGMIYLLILYIAGATALLIRRVRLQLMPTLMAGCAIALLPAMIISGNGTVQGLTFSFGQLTWFYFIGANGFGSMENGFSTLFLGDFIKSLFVVPFLSLGKIFAAVFSARGNGMKTFLKILLGIGIALIPSLIVVVLLSYDPSFVGLLKRIFDFSLENVIGHFFSLFFGVPVAMFLFSCFYGSVRKKAALFNRESFVNVGSAIKFLPQSTVLVAAIPLLLIYAIFFTSQWEIYLSAFFGILPADFIPAEYARAGFGQLCVVSVLNLLLIIGMVLFTRRHNGKTGVLPRILALLFSLITLGLMATAFAKLVLYIERFGLTPRRVYAAWFMAILAILFLLIIVKQVFCRFRLLPIATLVSLAMFGILAFSGSGQLIARYNIDRYLEGSLRELDPYALKELGDDAIPEMVRLVKELDQRNGTNVLDYHYDAATYHMNYSYNSTAFLLQRAAAREEADLFSKTLPRFRADQALKELGFSGKEAVDEYFEFSIDEFDYEDAKGYVDESENVQWDGFVNQKEMRCDTVEAAVTRADAEVLIEYDRVYVFRDVDNEMWRIEFYSEYESVEVYLNYKGQTQIIVKY